MTYRNRPAAIALACLTTALLTACSSNSPEAGRPDTAPPTPTAPSSSGPSSSTTPTTPSATTPPKRPAAATGSTLAAGEAFLTYYVDLLNYSYITGDPDPFLTESDKGCLGCKGIAGYVRKINGKNGGLQGDYKDHLIDVKEIYRGQTGKLGGSASIKTGTYIERATPGASPLPQPGSTGTIEFTLSPLAGNWVMYEMQMK